MMYDGENKIGRYDALDAQTNPTFYLYDADGKRKQKGTLHQVHGLGGELLAEPGGLTMTDYIYRNGDLFFQMSNKTSSARWLVKDHLGTPRII